MTDKQPDALRQAAWLKREGASCQRHYDLGVLIERQHTEIETLRAKLKAYEDLGGAGSDVQLLRMGYAAARLEIESLRAAVEHKDKYAERLGRELVAECRFSANETLRANQLKLQHGMQSKMHSEACETILVLKAEGTALQQGYTAARLEIESLNAQLHAAKQINTAQSGLLAAFIPGSALPGK